MTFNLSFTNITVAEYAKPNNVNLRYSINRVNKVLVDDVSMSYDYKSKRERERVLNLTWERQNPHSHWMNFNCLCTTVTQCEYEVEGKLVVRQLSANSICRQYVLSDLLQYRFGDVQLNRENSRVRFSNWIPYATHSAHCIMHEYVSNLFSIVSADCFFRELIILRTNRTEKLMCWLLADQRTIRRHYTTKQPRNPIDF